MRNMLIVIVLALSVAGLTACSRPVHSSRWYQQHQAVIKTTLERCSKYEAAEMNHPNCMHAVEAEDVIQRALQKKKWKQVRRENPYAGIDSYQPPALK
jgi:hypothetical protein